MFQQICTLLPILTGEIWKQKGIGVSTDCAANMVGQILGSVTGLQNLSSCVMYAVCCGT